jgi:hypothetical protein
MKYRPVPAFCERCERKIDDQTGWGVMMLCAVQPQPNGNKEPRENSLLICGYCFHKLARWVCPDEELQA